MTTARVVRSILVCVAIVGFAACKGTVADPSGDALQVDGHVGDVIEAGIDYGNVNTTLWVRYNSGDGPSQQVIWDVSVDGDTVTELVVTLGNAYGGTTLGLDHYSVNVLGQSGTACSGYVRNQGYDGETQRVTFDSRCLSGDTSAGTLWPTLRIAANVWTGKYSYDGTGWTGAVPHS